MRSLILLGLACTFIAAVRISPRDAVLTPQKEYLYKYETQVLNGIPANSKLFSGLKIKADVRVQVHVGHQWVVQLENIRVMKLNKELPSSMSPGQLIPTELFSELPTEIEKLHQEYLSVPMMFSWQNGKVSNLQFKTEEPEWSANLKRGIVSMFVVETQEPTSRNLESSKYHESMEYLKSFASVENHNFQEVFVKSEELMTLKEELSGSQSTSYNKFFTTMESTVDGECETVYSIMKDSETFKINKANNYEKCRHSPKWQTGLFSHLNTTFCNKDCQQQLMKRATHTDITLLGSQENFGIEEVDVSSKIWVTPFSIESGSFEAYGKQVLTLVKSQQISQKIHLDNMHRRPLQMTIPTSSVSTNDNTKHSEKKQEIVEEILQKLVPLCTPHISLEAAPLVARLSTVLKTVPTSVIVNMIEKYTQKQKEQQDSAYTKLELLLDVVPTLNHQNLDKILRQLLEKRVISTTRASVWVNMLSLTSPPTPKMIQTLLDIFQSVRHSESKMLKHSSILAAGSLMNKLVTNIERENLPEGMMQSEIESIVSKVKSMLEGTRDIHQKTLILKSIGNMGLVQFVPELSRLIRERGQPTAIRVNAIAALRKVSINFPRKVQAILVPVYMDRREKQQVRLTAFYVIMDSRPSNGVVQMIAQRLNKESNRQITSFVYSYFKTFAKTSNPCLRKLAKKCQQALLTLEPTSSTLQYSKNFHFDYFSKSLQVGDMIDLITIDSSASFLPEAILAKWSSIFMNQNTEIFEAGLNMKGLKTLFANLIGPNGILKDLLDGKMKISDLFKSSSQQGHFRIQKEIQKIIDNLKISERVGDVMENSAYLKVFGNYIATITVEARDYNDLLKIVMENLPKIMMNLEKGYRMNTLKTLSIIDSSYTLPTPVGIPVIANMSMVTLVHFEGHTELKGLPSANQLVKLVSKLLVEYSSNSQSSSSQENMINFAKQITGKFNIESSMIMNTRIAFGFNCFLVQTTSEIESNVQAKLPTKGTFGINVETKEIIAEFDVPQTESKILHASLKPLSIVRTFSSIPNAHVFVEHIKEQSINEKLVRQIPFNFNILEKALGIKIAIKGETLTARRVNAPLLAFGSQQIHLSIHPGKDTPKKIQIKAVYETDKEGEFHSMLTRFYGEESAENWVQRPISSEGLESESFESKSGESKSWESKSGESMSWVSKSWESTGSESDESKERKYHPTFQRSWELNSWENESEESRSRPLAKSSESRSNSKSSETSSMQSLESNSNQVKSSMESNLYKSKRKSVSKSSSAESNENLAIGNYRTIDRSVNQISKERFRMNNIDKNVQVDQRIRNPIRRQIKFEIRTIGSKTERFMAMTGGLIHSSDFLQHQFNLEVEHTPLIELQTSVKKLIIKNFLEIPRAVFESRSSFELTKRIPIYESIIFYGQKANPEKIMELKTVYGGEMSEQLTHKYKISTPLKLTTKFIFSEKTYKKIDRIAKMVKDVIKKTPYLLNFLSVDATIERNQPNQVNLIVASLSKIEQLVFAIETPEETIVIKGMPFMYVPLTRDNTPRTPLLKSVFHSLTKGAFRKGECRVLKEQVTSFNGQTYTIPETDCEVLIAKDCSQNKLFAVTARKISNNRKVVKFLIAGSKVEIFPGTNGKPMIVKVDGRRIHIAPRHEMNIKTQQKKTLVIRKSSASDKYITVVGMGLTLSTDCKVISLRVSPFFRGQTCGICGSFNSEKKFTGPHKESYKTAKQMAASYVIRSSSCNSENLLQAYGIHKIQEHHAMKNSERCEFVRRHAIEERNIDGAHKICISTESFDNCSPDCHSAEKMHREMNFHCLPASDWRTRWIVEQAEQRSVSRLSGKDHQFKSNVVVPKTCVPRY